MEIDDFGLYSTSRGFIAASSSPDRVEVFLNWKSDPLTYNTNHVFGIQELSNETCRFMEADSYTNLKLSSALNMLSENSFV